MIVMNVGYGLGNQMFQYAFAKALAQKNDDTFIIAKEYYDSENGKREYALDKFVLSDKVKSLNNHRIVKLLYSMALNKKSKFVHAIYRGFDRVFSPLKMIFEEDGRNFTDVEYFKGKINIYSGIFQSCKYFDDIKEEIVSDFVLKDIRQEIQNYGERLHASDSVCIHIRRGDSVEKEDTNICGIDYYSRAIDYIKNKIPQATIYAFSDDIDWVKNNISGVTPIDFTESMFEDLYLMTKCRNFIISNSTFSWWGQYLSDNNDKIVVAPQKWFSYEQTKDDYIYQNYWTVI